MSPNQVSRLVSVLDANYTVSNARYASNLEYKALTQNCTQVVFEAIARSADLNVIQQRVISYEKVESLGGPYLTFQTVDLDVIGLLEEDDEVKLDQLLRQQVVNSP